MSKVHPDGPGARRASPVQGGPERYEALLEVLEQQAQRAHEGPEHRRRRSYGPILLVVLIGVTAWLWILPPAWLIPPAPEPQPIEAEEAALRFGMYLQAQRIKAYELRHGRLPETLGEAGEGLPGASYRVLGAGVYELTGTTDRIRLTYRSSQPLREWVGAGADVVDEAEIP